ncbi:ImmA/IrrE family metallo-endopeptidase [Fictibacillus terranigra]|uniref:ImmA/IrrE family metallo-endopeptidase n=1 Tax=Fictibacillus terranigra TaxID=3058424 RepID=A0ABT8E4T0_9BACL|nr:ImmA/IrrE family metallo-endopeptidase [Fictibacillus sp. CENA-BCM004]MDN4072898.1 ImmA/IrrE family metallo-endopeptidase [Fictibacillus sp. CENA-BCM004]
MKKMVETIPNHVRIKQVKKKVQDYLEIKQIESPPIDAKEIIQQVKNIKIQESNEIEDAFVVYNKKKDEYGIVINTEHVKGRINWTYAHELGHIALNHAAYINDTELTDSQRKIIEREADVFARELLMPELMVKEKIVHPITPRQIGRLTAEFNVSWTAIINRLDELEIKSKDEIYELLHTKNKLKISEPDKTNNQHEILRLEQCPGCTNSDFSLYATYCKKCGYYLYNKCTDNTCNKDNVSDAYFCEYCGENTILGMTRDA